MRRLVGFLLTWLAVLPVFAQTTDDSLEKYSYLIVQYNGQPDGINYGASGGDELGTATGFFVRVRKRLFLVSNYHVVTSIDVYHKERYPDQFGTIKIRYYDRDNKVQYFPIDVDSIRRNSQIISFDEYPDLYALEIKGFPQDARLFSVEKMLYATDPTGNCTREAISYQYFPQYDQGVLQQLQQIRAARSQAQSFPFNALAGNSTGIFGQPPSGQPSVFSGNLSGQPIISPDSMLSRPSWISGNPIPLSGMMINIDNGNGLNSDTNASEIIPFQINQVWPGNAAQSVRDLFNPDSSAVLSGKNVFGNGIWSGDYGKLVTVISADSTIGRLLSSTGPAFSGEIGSIPPSNLGSVPLLSGYSIPISGNQINAAFGNMENTDPNASKVIPFQINQVWPANGNSITVLFADTTIADLLSPTGPSFTGEIGSLPPSNLGSAPLLSGYSLPIFGNQINLVNGDVENTDRNALKTIPFQINQVWPGNGGESIRDQFNLDNFVSLSGKNGYGNLSWPGYGNSITVQSADSGIGQLLSPNGPNFIFVNGSTPPSSLYSFPDLSGRVFVNFISDTGAFPNLDITKSLTEISPAAPFNNPPIPNRADARPMGQLVSTRLDGINFDNVNPTPFLGQEVTDQMVQQLVLQGGGSMYLLLSPETDHGSSGSPVFFKCSCELNGATVNKIVFAGVQSGINDQFKVSIIVRPQELVKLIAQKLEN
jgi:hypothetical protein